MEPPFAGRLREDLAGFALPASRDRVDGNSVEITGGDFRLTVRLSPFGLTWRRKGEDTPFLQDRPTQAYLASRKTGAISHFIARDKADRHYGLGDKTGRLDKTGRRFRIDAVDPCGYDAETSDPLYKMIPFYIVDGRRARMACSTIISQPARSISARRSTITTGFSAPIRRMMATSTSMSSPGRRSRMSRGASRGSRAGRLSRRFGRWVSA